MHLCIVQRPTLGLDLKLILKFTCIICTRTFTFLQWRRCLLYCHYIPSALLIAHWPQSQPLRLISHDWACCQPWTVMRKCCKSTFAVNCSLISLPAEKLAGLFLHDLLPPLWECNDGQNCAYCTLDFMIIHRCRLFFTAEFWEVSAAMVDCHAALWTTSVISNSQDSWSNSTHSRSLFIAVVISDELWWLCDALCGWCTVALRTRR